MRKFKLQLIDIFDIKKIEKYNADKLKCDFNLKLEYGQGSNFIIKPYKDIVDNFEEYVILNKNDLIKIICGENSTIAYVCGYSGGQLEVKSTIGDGYDLVGKNNVFNNLQKHAKKYKKKRREIYFSLLFFVVY